MKRNKDTYLEFEHEDKFKLEEVSNVIDVYFKLIIYWRCVISIYLGYAIYLETTKKKIE